MKYTYNDLLTEIGKIIDPGHNLPLSETKGIKRIAILENNVVEVDLAIKDLKQHEDKVKLEVIKLVKIKLEFPGIKLEFMESDYLKPGTKEIKYLAIASGKGGVGKSSVTANLAYALQRLGYQVGIIDADIYGASIPFITSIKSRPLETSENEKMIPLSKDGVEVISTEFFMPESKPLMWRGPLLGKMLSHYFMGVDWHEDTSIILIDLPPGTGDVAIDVKEYVPKSKVLVVTTPHPNASSVAVKAGFGATQIGHEVIGVIENMSYYFNKASNERDYIFGQNGGQIVSDKLGVSLFGQIPIGMPEKENTYIYAPDEMNGKIYELIAKKVIEGMDL